jgi:8-hydroxy-5-deazaflavin:NADPH oxidoreductase
VTEKKVGIIGSGTVAQTLAGGFAKHGFLISMGSRDPRKLDEFVKKSGGKVTATSTAGAAAYGDLVVLAVKGKAAKEALLSAGAGNLDGKTVIDVTNPIDDAPPVNGVLKYFTRLDWSLMEDLQEAVPGARFVKAFNMIGAAHMVDPKFGRVKPSMFICGNNDAAKKEVTEILIKFGFDVEDMGMAASARAIEPLCMLWCIPGLLRNEWNHAFRLLKK